MEILDRNDLSERLAGQREIIIDVIEAFSAHMPAKIEALQQAVKSANPLQIEECGHAVKGAARNISAPSLQEVALQIELAGQTGQPEVASKLIPDLEREFSKLQDELKSLLAELS